MTMPETVSNAEVARRVDDVRAVLAEDIAELRRALGEALPRELYVARHEALVRRVDTLEAHQARVEAEFRAALEKVTEERRAEIVAQAADARQNRRFLWSAIILPAASIVITIYQGLQGPA